MSPQPREDKKYKFTPWCLKEKRDLAFLLLRTSAHIIEWVVVSVAERSHVKVLALLLSKHVSLDAFFFKYLKEVLNWMWLDIPAILVLTRQY